MRICLLSSSYPPQDTEGISRQRQALATELAHLGHEVHVVTLGAFSHVHDENGVTVHRVAFNWLNSFSDSYPGLNNTLTRSQALYEGLYESLDASGFDIVDIPLWGTQGIVTQQFYAGCTILWLQTTLAKILKIHERNPSEEEQIKLILEKMILERAHGLLADSQSVLDSIRSDYGISTDAPTSVAYLGLPPLSAQPDRLRRNEVEALVVGRLEKRKGTPLLFEILPALLQQHPQLTIRFVGRDNSVSDGWQTLHKKTYPEYFKQRYPKLAARVFFDGYISEERLQAYYDRADLFLAPSLYESFGLTYLEAMRSGLPVITFSTGAATEIFAAGEADGAILVPAENVNEFAGAVKKLVGNSRLRNELGQAGLNRFQAAFTAQAMAQSTLEFYQQVLDHCLKSARDTSKIYQVMEALDFGDAVSKIAIDNANLLAELGQPKEILTRYADKAVRGHTIPRNRVLSKPDCGLIFHYWGYNPSTWMLPIAKGRKALYYHNITPPHFFSTDSVAYRLTSQGYAQLGRILDHFDLLIGDSRYNIQSLAPYLTRPLPALSIYPIIEPEKLRGLPYDKSLLEHLRSSRHVNMLFVGRIARNKHQDRLMQVLDYYYREISPQAHLWLVGNENGDPAYRAELEELRLSLISCDHIHFTGKIGDAQIYAYYRAADVFLSASEHEGFGMPLVEAMAFDIPVIAYAATAVPETMGNAGVLINTWDDQRVANLVHDLHYNHTQEEQLLAKQRQSLKRFTSEEAKTRLKAVINFLQSGETGAFIEDIQPKVK
jgi:L-malate glycosyltransferase